MTVLSGILFALAIAGMLIVSTLLVVILFRIAAWLGLRVMHARVEFLMISHTYERNRSLP